LLKSPRFRHHESCLCTLAGALLSIVLNPLLFHLLDRYNARQAGEGDPQAA
jgi:predicted Kef-type K+ transport protein